MEYSKYKINSDRFKNNFDSLAEIGATKTGGVNRPTFSKAHLLAREWFRNISVEMGFSFRIDDAGNHIARLECSTPDASTILLGSHLDSVPNGGRFDGGLGVIAGHEILSTIQDYDLQMPFNLEVIDFTDEEGTIVGFLGSSYLAGNLTDEGFENPIGGIQNLVDGLKAAGLTKEKILNQSNESHNFAGYLELHIEQGSRLIEAGIDIGVVTSIVGIGSYRVVFIGQENHAGTAPMQNRHDAAKGASDFLLAVHRLVTKDYPSCTANIGNIIIEPGAFNIIPKCATISLEYRAPEKTIFDKLDTTLINEAKKTAEKHGLDVKFEFLEKHYPSPMDKKIQTCIKKGAESLRLECTQLSSGAGHDAQCMASICPSGMIFIPSVNGISHSPREFSRWQDCINGANVLLHTVLRI